MELSEENLSSMDELEVQMRKLLKKHKRETLLKKKPLRTNFDSGEYFRNKDL